MSLLMPIFLLCEMMLVAVIHLGLSRSRFGQPETPGAPLPHKVLHFLAADFSWSRYVGAAMSILLFCYTQATATCISYLTCVEVGDSKVVFSAPTMDCWSSKYRGFLAPVVLALITYVVAFPLAVFVFLWNRHQILADRTHISPFFILRWSPLFQMYSVQAWYWQATVLLRRAVFVIISVALVGDAHARGMAFSMLNLASLLHQLRIRPFSESHVNAAEVVSLVILSFISMVISVYSAPYATATQVLLFFLIVPTIIAFSILMLRQKTQDFQERLRAKSKRPESQVDCDLPPKHSATVGAHHVDVELTSDYQANPAVIGATNPASPSSSAVPPPPSSATGRLTHAMQLIQGRPISTVSSDDWTADDQAAL